MKRRPRRPRRFVLILLLLAFGYLPASGGAAVSVAGAAADVRLLVSTIESQHPSPFHGISKEALEAAGEALAARADGMHRDELVVELMRLIASLGERDGHSGIYPGDEHSPRLHLYPLKLYDFSDGLIVVGESGVAGALGARLVAIEGRPIAEVAAMVRPLIARDNEWQRRLLAPEFLVTAEVLHGLGVTPSAERATFTLESSSGRREVQLAPLPSSTYSSQFGFPGQMKPVGVSRPPLWIRNRAKSQAVTLLQRGRVVFVTYNSTGPTDALAERIVRLARKRVFRRLIVDVRLNGGGDNTTYFSLVNALRQRAVNRYRQPALLIGRVTFSAAGNFVTDVERRTRARFFGEPTGAAPNQWGDAAQFRLPNVGLRYYLPRYYVQRSTPDDPRVTTEPHIRVDLSSADWFAGRDPVLEAALR
jgi:hypothetical protein